MSAQPYDRNFMGDTGLQQQGGGDVGAGGDGADIKKVAFLSGHCSMDQILDGRAVHRRVRVGHELVSAAMDEPLRHPPDLAKQTDDLVIATLHTVLWAGGTVVIKRGGIDRFHIQAFWGK